MNQINPIFVFTDAATSPQAGVAVGIFLCLKQQEVEQLMRLTPEQLFIQLTNKVNYKFYQSKKSTWSEIKTVIDALQSIEIKLDEPNQIIEIYTDCQSVCDLLGRRKEKLEKNNFITHSGSILQNAELYKELYCVTNKFQIKTFKIKGHQPNSNFLSWQEKIFSVLDKLSRKELRLKIK